MGKRYNKEYAAEILVDSALMGDKDACKKHGISTRTLSRYRKDFRDEDSELADAVRYRCIQVLRITWKMKLQQRIADTIDKAQRAIDAAIKKDPVGALEEINNHLFVLGDLENTSRMLYAHILEKSKQTSGGEPSDVREVVTEDQSPFKQEPGLA